MSSFPDIAQFTSVNPIQNPLLYATLVSKLIEEDAFSSKFSSDQQSVVISAVKQNVQAVLKLGYIENSQPFAELLIAASRLFSYALTKDEVSLFSELVSVFNESNSFYFNNANWQTPSVKWIEVIDSFLRTNSIENAAKRLQRNDAKLTDSHFSCFSNVLDYVKNRMDEETLKNVLIEVVNGFSAFVCTRNFDKVFLQIYSQFYNAAERVIGNYSDEFSCFVSLITTFLHSNIPENLTFCVEYILKLFNSPLKQLLVSHLFSDQLVSINFSLDQAKQLSPVFRFLAENHLFNESSINKFIQRGQSSIITDFVHFIDHPLINKLAVSLVPHESNIELLIGLASTTNEENIRKSIIHNVLTFGNTKQHYDTVYHALVPVLSNPKFTRYLFDESLHMLSSAQSNLFVDVLLQLFSMTTVPEDSINIDFVMIQLLSSPDDSSWLKLLDIVLSSTRIQLSASHFENITFDDKIWSLLGHLFEHHGFEAFDKSAIGFLLDRLNVDYSTVKSGFIRFAFAFILRQNVQTKKIEFQSRKLNNFIVRLVPLDYDDLLFSFFRENNDKSICNEVQDTIVKLYEKIDSTRISDVLSMFYKRLENSQNDHVFASVLNTFLRFSQTIEKDINSQLLGIRRHSSPQEPESYPLQVIVVHSNGSLLIDCNLTMKISELKAIVATKLQIRAEPLFIYCDTRWLQDSYTIGDYHIANNTRLELGGVQQPMNAKFYPTVLLSENFAAYLLKNLHSNSEVDKRKAIMDFLDYLPTEKNTLNVINDGNCFIAKVRSAQTVDHLKYIIDTACSFSRNEETIETFNEANVFTTLFKNLTNNKFGGEGIFLILKFFHAFFTSSFSEMLNEFVSSLLSVYSVNGNDELYFTATDLLNDFYKLLPTETTNIILSNMSLFAEAIRNVPINAFEALKRFAIDLNDELSVSLFAYSYSSEMRFLSIYQHLQWVNTNENTEEYFSKCIKVLGQIDDAPFRNLFNSFVSKLNKHVLEQHHFIVDELLKIVQHTKSDLVREMILQKVAHFATQSKDAKQSIINFSSEMSNACVNSFNVSHLEFERSDLKTLLSDRDDMIAIIHILYHIFPLCYYLISEQSFDHEQLWKLQYLFKQMIVLHKRCIDINDVTSLFDLPDNNPMNFFYNIMNILPPNMKSVFQGILHLEIEGDDTDFFTSSDEQFYTLTLPILGFKELHEALIYFFKNTDHFTGPTQYYIPESNEHIDAHKSMKFETPPPVLVLELNRFFNNGVLYSDNINVPFIIDVNDICVEHIDEYENNTPTNYVYHLNAAIIRDSLTHKFKSIVKVNNQWFVYDVDKSYPLVDHSLLKQSYIVFYTLENSRLPAFVNGIPTELELEYSFNLTQYIDESTFQYLEEFNEQLNNQRCAFSAPTMEFMMKHTTILDYLRYFVNVLCHSTLTQQVLNGAEYISNNINKDGNLLLDYLHQNFDSVASSLTHSQFSLLLSDVIIAILTKSNEDLAFNFISQCVEQIKKKNYEQVSSISRIILKYVLISESNKQRASNANWAQELIWYLYSVFDFKRTPEFLQSLDFSNLFNALSVLITRENRPNDIFGLLRIKDQALVSSKHSHSFIAFLIKLDSSNILRSDFGNHTFSTAITDFEMKLESGRVPNIPTGINIPDFFTEIQRQIETGNAQLRSNVINYFNQQLVLYLGSSDEEIRLAAKHLYYAAHEGQFECDSSIRQLLVNLSAASECSTIVEVATTLMKKNNLYDEGYLQYIFDNSQLMRSSMSSTHLLLSVCNQYDKNILESHLTSIIESVPSDFDVLIDFLVTFSVDAISSTLESPRWSDIVHRIDSKHYTALIQKLLSLMDSSEIAKKFVIDSITSDNTLSLLNTFLSNTTRHFSTSNLVQKIFKLIDFAIKRSNELKYYTNELQYYLRSLISISDTIISHSNEIYLNEAKINLMQLIPFFSNFWGELASDKLVDLCTLICRNNSLFEVQLRDELILHIATRIEPNDHEKWYLSVVFSRIALAISGDDDDSIIALVEALKKAYDEACLQHQRDEKARPTALFNLYLDVMKSMSSEQSDWSLRLATKLLPESHFLIDEEREFYQKIFSQVESTDEISEKLVLPETNVPRGGLDLQRLALLARIRPEIKHDLVQNFGMTREEAFDMARQDWFLEQFVVFLYDDDEGEANQNETPEVEETVSRDVLLAMERAEKERIAKAEKAAKEQRKLQEEVERERKRQEEENVSERSVQIDHSDEDSSAPVDKHEPKEKPELTPASVGTATAVAASYIFFKYLKNRKAKKTQH
ncbi:hypothetical protein TRFO_02328 [Tritrichomonas foetus]|uniref:Ubiquitin-like domain-containing protein n=1 Tax=Tritrichomonas foetus TaxID=1144522 RepID=A0A1J4J808_9EUKA|nr:hypothetical protein TRFO_02328 [Tritrichomonas foetus]|eukprot:OHS93811.1 hypothetical protein TRFO_02328 [Tritrichomonas foetus]